MERCAVRTQYSTPGRRLLALALLALSGLAAATVTSQPDRDLLDRADRLTESRPDRGYPAVSQPSTMIAMSFVVSGVISEVNVREGDVIAVGDVLMRLNDAVQRHTVEAQRLAAMDTTAIESSQRQLDLATYDLEAVLEAQSKRATAPREVERARAEKALREINVRAAELELDRTSAVYRREQARLEDMTMLSSIDGVVLQVGGDVGQAVDALEPSIQVARIDPLYMDVAVPIDVGLELSAGDEAAITWRDIETDKARHGRVMHVLPVADSASNSIVVRVEIPNPEALAAGLHAYVRFLPRQEP